MRARARWARRRLPELAALAVVVALVLTILHFERSDPPAPVNQEQEASRVLQVVRSQAQLRSRVIPVAHRAASSSTSEALAAARRVVDHPQSAAASMTELTDRVDAFWAHQFAAAGLPYTPARYAVLGPDQTAASPSCRFIAGDPGPLASVANSPPSGSQDPMSHGGSAPHDPMSREHWVPAGVCVLTPVEGTEPSVFLSAPWILDQAAGIPTAPERALFVIYVVAHEMGHYVQSRIGLPYGDMPSNQVELMADCLSGIYAGAIYPPGTLTAADVAQAQFQGLQESSESSSHGTLSQRIAAFRIGLDTGDTAKCMGAD